MDGSLGLMIVAGKPVHALDETITSLCVGSLNEPVAGGVESGKA